MQREIKVFVDFDGTITRQDIGEAIFRKFGRSDEVNQTIEKLMNNEISARECWMQLCNSVIKADTGALNSFIDSLEIDSSFHNLVELCRKAFIPIFVLSDGFDYYIERIFRKEKLNNIKYFSNLLQISEEGRFIPSFPFYNSRCRSSANCKMIHIIENTSDEDVTVFAGDGVSDRETVHYCDYIFAKDDLLKYCEKERISYFPFKDFNDISARLQVLRSRRNIRKRHQAELKRREAYSIE